MIVSGENVSFIFLCYTKLCDDVHLGFQVSKFNVYIVEGLWMNILAMFLFQWFNGIKEMNFKDIFLIVSHVQLCPVMSAILNFHPMFILVHLRFDHVGNFRNSFYLFCQRSHIGCLIRNKSHSINIHPRIVDIMLNFKPLISAWTIEFWDSANQIAL